MIHVRIDDCSTRAERRFRCGLTAELPPGDVYYFQDEAAARLADCPGCNPDGPAKLGTPLSALSGRPGKPGWEAFKQLAASWGYD